MDYIFAFTLDFHTLTNHCNKVLRSSISLTQCMDCNKVPRSSTQHMEMKVYSELNVGPLIRDIKCNKVHHQ